MGTDSPVCSLRITTISPGVNALRLHGWHHPLLSYLPLVLFFHSASQPFSWCWCGPDSHQPVSGHPTTLHGTPLARKCERPSPPPTCKREATPPLATTSRIVKEQRGVVHSPPLLNVRLLLF